MCGVFGFIAAKGRQVNMDRLRKIAQVTERRGPHAFGFAWVDSRGRLRMYKQTGRVSDHLGILAMAADARMLIGHCRWATHGDPANNLNNHPHSCDGGWIVHNGVVRNDAALVQRHRLVQVTECDSEVLALMVEQFDGTLAQRCAAAVGEIEGAPAVLMGLWAQPLRMVAVRAGNPLCIGRAASGIYLASLKDGMPRDVKSVKDGSTIEFRIDEEGNPDVKTITQTITQSQTSGGNHRTDEGGQASAAGGGRRSKAPLFDGADDGDSAVSLHEGAAKPFAIKSRRSYGF